MTSSGCVYLVGAGPGDPDLLTVKALRLFGEADALVYDRLVSDEILALVPDGVSRIFVGKEPGCHHVPQHEINDMLVRLAHAGHRVVRLKGGDPLVFGRGGEEALHLARHGVRFEVVPGVTAAVACAAYAGIPVTHRGLARGVQLITGHCRADAPLDLDWRTLADPQVTLVVYMGLSQLAAIRDGLLGAGRSADTPVALIERGTTPRQRQVITTIGTLVGDMQRARLASPVLVIVGEVVRLAAELDWYQPTATDADRPRGEASTAR